MLVIAQTEAAAAFEHAACAAPQSCTFRDLTPTITSLLGILVEDERQERTDWYHAALLRCGNVVRVTGMRANASWVSPGCVQACILNVSMSSPRACTVPTCNLLARPRGGRAAVVQKTLACAFRNKLALGTVTIAHRFRHGNTNILGTASTCSSGRTWPATQPLQQKRTWTWTYTCPLSAPKCHRPVLPACASLLMHEASFESGE
jgi:hypothetical protein